MVFGLFGGKKKPKEKEDTSYQSTVKLRQEIDNLEAKLRQEQQENAGLQKKYAELKEDYSNLEQQNHLLETEKHAIEKVAEIKIKNSKIEAMDGHEKMYKAKIKSLETQIGALNSEMQRKLTEFSRYERETSGEQTKLEGEVCRLNSELESVEKQRQEYVKSLPKIEERLKEIVKKKKTELLSEGSIVTATIFEKVEEERRATGYRALGPNGEIFYVRTSKAYALGEDVTVIVKTLPIAEAGIIDNPNVKLKVGKLISFNELDIYERNKEGLVAICQNEDKLIIEVGEHITGLGNKKIEVYKEEEGVFYARRA